MTLIDEFYEFECELMRAAEQSRSRSKIATAEALIVELKTSFAKNNAREFLKRWGLLLDVKDDKVIATPAEEQEVAEE